MHQPKLGHVFSHLVSICHFSHLVSICHMMYIVCHNASKSIMLRNVVGFVMAHNASTSTTEQPKPGHIFSDHVSLMMSHDAYDSLSGSILHCCCSAVAVYYLIMTHNIYDSLH